MRRFTLLQTGKNQRLTLNAQRQSRPRFDLEDRLLEFSARVIRLVDALPNTRAANHLAGQLLRCGTSPYGNHGEVEAAESRKDFIHRLKICLKENLPKGAKRSSAVVTARCQLRDASGFETVWNPL